MCGADIDIRISDDPAGEALALIVTLLREATAARGTASLALAGGGTPLALYRRLAESDVAWERVHLFWGDERLVPPDDPGSNYGQARDVLLRRVPLPETNIHRLKGELPAEAAVIDYAWQLRHHAEVFDPDAPSPWPRLDVALLGLGDDGHTASLFPGSPVMVSAPVLAVTANYAGRPAARVTLTPPVFNDARHVLFLVAGASKADAVAATLREPDDPVRYPAQRIRPTAGRLIWFLDRAAAAALPLTGAA